MLEDHFVRPETVDRIRASWIAEPIEKYVRWLEENRYSPKIVTRRVPLLLRFGEYAAVQGATMYSDLPDHIERFVDLWIRQHGKNCKTPRALSSVEGDARNPIEQMLSCILPNYTGRGRTHKALPFIDQAAGFFPYLEHERGLRKASIVHYEHYLRRFEGYLQCADLRDLKNLSPELISSFVVDRSALLSKSSQSGLCVCLRVFLQYLRREDVISRDLSCCVESPRSYRCAHLPRSISWDDVGKTIQGIDRRTPTGKRDYSVMLLLATYGLRGVEVANLKLEHIDWKRNRLLIPERKAGHCTAYPLSSDVGNAILEYLQNGRPEEADRHVFYRHLAPRRPMSSAAVSARVAHYLKKAGVTVVRPGSHTLRHSCIQRLVDSDFPLKIIGDYVGHRSPSSTEIYTKIQVESLRQVALGDGEAVL
jgi:site-specific recombinase XerD